MKKSCIATLGAYLLSKKTDCNLFPQGVLARSDVSAGDGNYPPPLEPNDLNIRKRPFNTRLYGAPTAQENEQITALKNNPFTENDRQDEHLLESNWDGLEGFQTEHDYAKWMRLHLHFYAVGDAENETRRSDQTNARQSFVRDLSDGRLQNYRNTFERKWFPVSRLDPPHSDVTVPRSHDAIADFWEMEHAFRKVCHRFILNGTFQFRSAREANGKKVTKGPETVEHWIHMPKNLIAYFVQRVLQFPPETFGRFRISDGSHTHFFIDYNGTPRFYVVGETSYLHKEYERVRRDFDRGSGDIGLDVPAAKEEDLGAGDSPQIGSDKNCEYEEGDWEDEDADDDENCTNDRDDGEIKNRQFSLF